MSFVANKKQRPSETRLSHAEANSRLLEAAADVAWWFGWSVADVYELELEEFEDWFKEATRQMKAGYRKA